VIATFVEFALRATRNRIVARLRRLRDPRYLVGAAVAVAYFWLVFFRNTRNARGKMFVVSSGDLVVDFLSIVILVIMIAAWALPADSGGLQFSEAEIAFLFPAPVRRRDLLLYKIIRAQPQALVSAFAFFIFGWRRSWVIGTWAALSVLGVYFTLVALGRARLKLLHVGFVARLVIVSAILTALASFGTDQLRAQNLHLKHFDARTSLPQLNAVFHGRAAEVLLFVPRLFATAASAPTTTALATSIAGLLLLGVGFFFIAARLNISFEEASIAASARRAERMARLQARHSGRMQVSYRRIGPLFRLGETGAAEVAIVWKNVIALMRTAFGIIVLLIGLGALMLGIAFYQHEEVTYNVFGGMFLFLSAFFPLVSPQMFANDLRLDLARSEILKSYPLLGERLVAAEIAAPLVVITAMEMFYAGCGALLMHLAAPAGKFAAFAGTPEFFVTVLILTLPVCAMLLLIRNAVPLYFPAWSMRAPDDVRSFVNVGQRIVVLLANLLALIIALIPAGLVFLPTAWLAHKFFSDSALFIPAATVPAAAVIVFELWLGLKMLGARFDAMDVSNEFDLLTV
jgi:ABC-2 type transport system permease protein